MFSLFAAGPAAGKPVEEAADGELEVRGFFSDETGGPVTGEAGADRFANFQ